MCSEEFELKFEFNDKLSEKAKRKLCNENLMVNRGIVSSALAAFKANFKGTVKCLDGIAGCGVYGMLWQKYLHENIEVTVNDSRSEVIDLIQNNLKLNNLELRVLNQNPCILTRTESFDFIFLNCKTYTSYYLDSVFSKLQDQSLLVITTSEDPSLYWQAPDVALRSYGGTIVKTTYHREVAVRLVIAEMARAAARYSKGLQVLCVVGYKSQQSFTIIASLKKGASNANLSLKNIQRLIHCSLCEEREFIPLSGFVTNSPTSLLDCECNKNTQGKTAYEIGPLWSGDIYNSEFIEAMISSCKGFPWEGCTNLLLEQILNEALCVGLPVPKEPEVPCKKIKLIPSSPCFYYNTHRHSSKSHHLIKMNLIIENLRRRGFRASRTHFDTEAVRTNARLKDLYRILQT